MAEFLLSPPLLLMLGSVVLAAAPRNVLPRTVLRALLLALPVYSLWRFWGLDFGDYAQFELFGQTLTLVRIDPLSRIFVVIFHLAALIGSIYSFYVKDNFQPLVRVFYAGSALGVVLAGDLWSLFLFWEVAAVSSALLVWVRRSGRAAGAGLRYLGMQMVSGVLLLAGIVLLRHEVGAAPGWAEFRNLTGFLEDGGLGFTNLAATLIFLAFGLKAAFPLLHSWLIDAYPESTPAGAVFLSAFTTKFAIYALARAFPGQSELIWIGGLMTAFPIFFAVIENDLRRVLAYSMTNQLGFMVVGIGIGTELAINGAVAHAFADILFKGLLFMAMGAVLYRVGHVNGSDLGGLYKSMPITTGLCIIGAASISALPAVLGLRHQVAHHERRRLQGVLLALARAPVRLRRRLSPRRDQDPLLRLLPPRLRDPLQGGAAVDDRRDGPGGRGQHDDRPVATGGAVVRRLEPLLRAAAVPGPLRRVHEDPRHHPEPAPVLLGPGLRHAHAHRPLSAGAALGESGPRTGSTAGSASASGMASPPRSLQRTAPATPLPAGSPPLRSKRRSVTWVRRGSSGAPG